ncbi:CDC48 family AAA ATPase [Candidatus Woesearchaeota archaeon]|jgi:transitional endoplasmic reticulum ATPase|nr:CDC48 family AAA ATPase [Candidatus Woesearchaeota archaeon]
MTDKTISLKVQEAYQEEAYKGIVRIDSQTMREIGVKSGEIVEIKGGRTSVGIVDRAYPSDIGQRIIRMDGIIRRNARTGIGEEVKVQKADVREAKTITIAPAQQGVMIQAANPSLFKQGLLGRAVTKGDVISLGGAKRRKRTMSGSPFEDIFNVFEEINSTSFGFGSLKFIVADIDPSKQPAIITENTSLKISSKTVEVKEGEEKIPEVNYEDIGGLQEEIKKIREMVELPLKNPEIFESLGISPPKGVLLHGPPGTGKTLLAKAVATETNANFILVNGPELLSKFYGETEKKIRKLFEDAEKNAPTIIFIDEIDAIAPKREETYGEVERRMVSQLLTVMDGLNSRGRVIVIGATNRQNSLDPALRRPGRFDREINIGVPNKEGRLKILQIHTRNMPLTKDVDLVAIASKTHGFVGADLESLCKEAAMNVIRREMPKLNLKEGEISQELKARLQVTKDDFIAARKIVRPSSLREVLVEAPDVKWTDVGGLDSLKEELKEAIEWPLKYPQTFTRMGIKPPRGILMYGPPGTGKTLLAKAVANESESNFILVKGPELLTKWVGESEKGVRKIFEKARETSPTIIFFDEIDALATRRGLDSGSQVTERVVNALLAEMDGLEELNDVVVLAATNRPDLVDPALMRPGRFDRIIATQLPDEKTRLAVLKVHTRTIPLAKDVNLEEINKKLEFFNGADIQGLCREAAMAALRKDKESTEVTQANFEKALEKIMPSLQQEEIKKYKTIEEKYLKAARVAQQKPINQSYLG